MVWGLCGGGVDWREETGFEEGGVWGGLDWREERGGSEGGDGVRSGDGRRGFGDGVVVVVETVV